MIAHSLHMLLSFSICEGRHKARPTVDWREEMKIRDKAKQMEGLVQVLHGLDVVDQHDRVGSRKQGTADVKTSPDGISVQDCCQDDGQDGD